jgi:hypothetical protein
MDDRSKGNVESAYDVMVDISRIAKGWDRKGILSGEALDKIEKLILDYQRRVWAREH